MDQICKQCLRRFQCKLIKILETSEYADDLYSMEIIDSDKRDQFLDKKKETAIDRAREMLDLIRDSDRCTRSDFFEIFEERNEEICKKIRAEIVERENKDENIPETKKMKFQHAKHERLAMDLQLAEYTNVYIENLDLDRCNLMIGKNNILAEQQEDASASGGMPASDNSTKQDLAIFRYRELADDIQSKVYNRELSEPSKGCLSDCGNYIDIKLPKRMYDCHFAYYEGQADVLRTSEHVKGPLHKHPIYKCLELLIENTSFPNIAKMIYHFRYAAALAVSGCDDIAMEYARMAYKDLQQFLQRDCMAKCNASCIYGYINVHLQKYSSKADPELKRKILDRIPEGLHQAEKIKDDPIGIQRKKEAELETEYHKWTRMFLVKKAFCLLAIGLHSEDIPVRDTICQKDREEAKRCLDEVTGKHSNKLDDRRKMLILRGESKYLLLAGECAMAREKLRKAYKISEKFKREKNTFHQMLKNWNG